MTHKKFSVEEIFKLLAEFEQRMQSGESVDEATKAMDISYQTLSRWLLKYQGVEPSYALRLKLMEEENNRLKKMVAQLELDKVMLKELSKGNF